MKHSHELIQKIKNNKVKLNQLSTYNEKPKMSAILLSFNHDYNVEDHCNKLIKSSFDEVIICEDGSIDQSMYKWVDRMNYKNHYILRSNDIHELRTYEKAIHMSEADFVCLLQDDDVLPDNNDWLDYAMFLFEKYPDLAVIGGARGKINFARNGSEDFGLNKKAIPYKEPEAKKDMMFIESVNIGPYFIRKSVFLELGGWDRRCSNAGEPGILFECEFCYRVWKAGYQVALTRMPVKLDDDDRGTTIFNKGGIRQINCQKNINLMQRLYQKDHSFIKEKIGKLNNQHLLTKKG